MRALITGISGFAGTHLAEHLIESGDAVIGCSSRGAWLDDTPPSVVENAEILRWNIDGEISPATRRRIVDFAPNAVYHLAAISVPLKCGSGDPTPEAVAVNVRGTAAVLDVAGSLPEPPRLLLASSCYVYAPVPIEQPRVSEGAPLGPLRGYGKSKVLAENIVHEAAAAGRLDAVVARAFQHSGPRQTPEMILPDWARQIASSDDGPIRVICRDTYLDISDVRDVVRAYRALVVHGKAHTAYNVGSGECQRSGDLLLQLLELANCARDVVELDAGRRQHPIADVSRIERDTPWRPKIGIRQTLNDVLEYWQRRHAAR